MKAYLTSIGEKTADICKEQLEKLGLEVVLLDKKESWEDKYRSFINTATEDCIRIDADIIPNENIKELPMKNRMMTQALGYDFYKNKVGVIGILYYSEKALEIIRNNFDNIDWRRPEATAWRLPEINLKNETIELVCGMHGFFQDKETIERAYKNKIDRKQIKDYDFDLVNKIMNL
jgi:hypothetical protein